jgi:hypothetical protein
MARFPVRRSPLKLGWVQLWLDIEGTPGRLDIPGGGSALVAFMSFAVSRGFGATHPLIALADRLHDEHGIRFGPLTTFYEAEAEDAEDREKLELAWQEAAPLAAELRKTAAAIRADAMCETLARRGDGASIPDEAEALAALLDAPAARAARVRLVYAL